MQCGGWSHDKLRIICTGASFSLNCAVDKELTLDYFALQQWVSECVKKRKKQAWSSLIHSPNRSRGHGSCGRHPALHRLPCRHGAFDLYWPWSNHVLLYLLANRHHPTSFYTSMSCPNANFNPYLPFCRIMVHVPQQRSETGLPRNMVRNTIALSKEWPHNKVSL